MVVRHVAERIDAAGISAAQGEIGIVGLDRDLVGEHRIVPASDP